VERRNLVLQGVIGLERSYVDLLIDASDVIHTQNKLSVSPWWPAGLLVVKPAFDPPTFQDALGIRQVADGLLCGWIDEHKKAGYRVNCSDGLEREWKPKLREWRELPCLSLIGWTARGLPEWNAAVFADIILSRCENELLTIVTVPLDPYRLHATWHCDEAVIDGLRKASVIVNVNHTSPVLELRRR
jgi:hypothetical protein